VIRWLIWTPLAVLGVLAVVFAGYALKHDPFFYPDAMVGKPAPDIAVAPLDGGAPIRVRAALQGPTFVNFFASWCVPCVQEAPTLLAMKGQGARIVAIAFQDEPVAANRFLERYGDPFVLKLIDQGGRAGVEFGVSGVPETFLVGADGVILAKHSGPLSMADADAMLKKAQAAIR
jgi:cytochrome c biogenesis protein CcmG/thiol:disulfide interchange protein DsbE